MEEELKEIATNTRMTNNFLNKIMEEMKEINKNLKNLERRFDS